MLYNFDQKELTKEKSLLEIAILSRKIKANSIQLYAYFFVLLVLSLNAFILEENNYVLLINVREWAQLGFSFSITTLGFLIAGFTIFATLSNPRMLLKMMEHINDKTNLPTLKYNFFTFMKVFIGYVFFLVIYALIIVFGGENGFISKLFLIFPQHIETKIFLIKTSYIVVGFSFFYLLGLLKSFIFNIYTTVMNCLRWEYNS